ncbi:PilZ domain-containing protein [Pseudomonas sp.]|jgi:hypothetical protein|uniref:PilZ domain-containing protein n=1 Tax=Pseudomonas sp. TaxID=306 RepID=UPI00272C83CC|nr:PilZ domain-containing protein [Pseudomonas sp.]
MSFHDQQYNEKRDFLRMQIETAAVLRLIALGEAIDVVCQDLSSQGVQLKADREVVPGTTVELSIPSPTPGLQGLEATGTVVRCSAAETGGYSIGLQFNAVK